MLVVIIYYIIMPFCGYNSHGFVLKLGCRVRSLRLESQIYTYKFCLLRSGQKSGGRASEREIK